MVGSGVDRHHPPEQPGQLECVLHVDPDDRFRCPRAGHAGQVDGALQVPPAIAAVLQQQVETKPAPSGQHGHLCRRGERLQVECRERARPHHLMHRLGHRGDPEVEVECFEGGNPRGELTDELVRLTRMNVDQRFPAGGVGHSDREVHRFGYAAEGHPAGHRHEPGSIAISGPPVVGAGALSQVV